MKKAFRIKLDKGGSEYIRYLILLLLKEFLIYRAAVVSGPHNAVELHHMRIAGKSLRYVMEVFQPLFGKNFSLRLEEVVHVLDVMGTIHDKDVLIMDMTGYLKKIDNLNSRSDLQDKSFPTQTISRIIDMQEIKRNELFNELCLILERWSDESFIQHFERSMKNAA